jgi:NADH:ubiquinone oxidoreductase subunit 2 (subunit N)
MLFFLFNDVLLVFDNAFFTFILIIFCLFNILVGTIIGADQDTFKRFIANSSIQFHGFAVLLLLLLKGDIFVIFTNYFMAYLLGYFALIFFLNSLQNVDQNKNDLNFLSEYSFNLNSLNVSLLFRFYLFILLVSLSGIL